jgi:predicted nucleotidyltransferase component of viral defense system
MSKNLGESAKARLANKAREKGIGTDVLLRRYALEGFLRRLSMSPWQDKFCLKGGLMMAVWNNGDMFRPTSDVDLNGYDTDSTADKVAEMVAEVVAIDAQDGVEFDLSRLKVAKSREGLIPGGKIVFDAVIHTSKVRMNVDVGFGNVITPDAEYIEYPSLLDAPKPRIRAYPPETTLAEKFHAMVHHGLLNTRYKDYYDIWTIKLVRDIDQDVLADAIARTFAFRETEFPEGMPSGLSDEFIRQNRAEWEGFLASEALMLEPPPFEAVVEEIRGLLLPALERARELRQDQERGGPSR